MSLEAQQNRKSARSPNWIILFCDDLGYGDPVCFGGSRFRTPNIDRLAGEGARLTEFYAAPTCTPARASLLTGRYPLRSGLTRVLIPREHFGLPESEVTMATALKQRGYRTACIGKWHLGDLPPYRPNRHGFDEFYGLLYSNDMTLPVVHWPAMRLYQNDEVIESPVKQRTLTERFTQRAVQFIESNAHCPFLLYLPYTAPHLPCAAAPSFAGKSGYGCYGDVVEELDSSVGKILSVVRARGLEQDTIVMFSSDNGPEVATRGPGGSTGGLRGGKRSTWEGGVRTPCIVRLPGRIPAGSVRTGITSLLDVFTTVLNSTGTPVPEDRAIDGLDLSAFLEGRSPSPRETFAYYRGKTIFAVRSRQWKIHFWKMTPGPRGRYTRVARCKPVELYDLESDPAESRNVAADHPSVVADLQRLRERFVESVVPGKPAPPRWRSLLPAVGKNGNSEKLP